MGSHGRWRRPPCLQTTPDVGPRGLNVGLAATWQDVAVEKGAGQFVLLSAICVQKPTLTFQAAKLKFEEALQASGLTYSIVRPTAFFKSLGGQVAPCKVRQQRSRSLSE